MSEKRESEKRGILKEGSGDVRLRSVTEAWETCPDCGVDTINGQGIVLCPACGWGDEKLLSTDGGTEGGTTETPSFVATAGIEPRELNDSVCLVTGASRGIGRCVARELGEAGAHVVVNYRSSADEAHEVCDAVEAGPGDATVMRADISDREDVKSMAREVRSEAGRVDVLVNNAGINADSTFENLDPEEWRRVLSVNLDGAYYVTKAFFDDIKTADDGRLINVSSIVGRRGNFGQANYAASKSGLEGFTKTLSLELAPHGSTANCVSPGFTLTDMVESLPEKIKSKILEDVPMRRFSDPKEIADVIRFLASPRSSYVTGQVIGVDGGMGR